jgi:hypothetical protein
MAPTWLDVLDHTVRMCVTHGRVDLAQQLRRKRAQLLSPTLRVVVVGEPRQGKSQLVNALINAPVCPVGGAVGTAIPTVVHHAEAPVAALVHSPAEGSSLVTGPALPQDVDALPAGRIPVPVTELASRISTVEARSAGGPVHAEVGVPRRLLASGLVLVDTPGIDGTPRIDEIPGIDEHQPGTEQAHIEPTAADPVSADVIVLVSDATQELSTTEVNHLVRLTREHPYVILAITKIDLVTQWRLVAERNRQRLASAGVTAATVSVSAALRLQAARTGDPAINDESGFPDLIARLMRYLRAKPDMLAPTSAALLVGRVIEQLAAPLRAGLSAPRPSEPLARLHEAQGALDELRRCSTRWQGTLADEMADLRSDIDFDLRDRTRRIIREADQAFDAADPLRAWDPFQSWLDQALVEAAEANFGWLVERCEWITGRVADHFIPYGADLLPQWKVEPPHLLRERPAMIERPALDRFTVMQKVYIGLRGSYLGVLMLGLATTLAGMPLINPISVGAGVLFAGKSIWDESRSQLKRRQALAKAAAQRHVDDFFLRLSKDCKDTARQVQSALRDHFTATTEQIHDGIVHSLRTAKQAADADVAERDQRQRDIQQRMERLAALYERAQALTTVSATATLAAAAPAGLGSGR